ncbi:hypothetical protein C6P45_000946 [Maudiozyma exigua]|uniref:Methyltransferase domain-containing protein n=1 Tax=Maudiozyma exigua TaxID=34358 RepID=A0A9P6W558_MAUEX|nr:hypothetical protein C6P45_000946 [Kazachstania exigua]
MSQFSQTDFKTDNYSNARPNYPLEFYEYLSQYHTGGNDLLVDVGCGPGVATFQLVENMSNFKRIIGTDISDPMIKEAQEKLKTTKQSNGPAVEFQVSSSEDFSFLQVEQKCDMITAAECAHWFNFNTFQNAVANNLNPHGTFAIWGYIDSVLFDYPDTDELMLDLQYGEDKLGPYWEQPGRTILRGLLRDKHLDSALFERIEENHIFARETAPQKNCSEMSDITKFPLRISKQMTLTAYIAYLRTCSAYHAWKKDTKNSTLPDPCDQLVAHLQSLHPELKDMDRIVHVTWSSFYLLGTRR